MLRRFSIIGGAAPANSAPMYSLILLLSCAIIFSTTYDLFVRVKSSCPEVLRPYLPAEDVLHGRFLFGILFIHPPSVPTFVCLPWSILLCLPANSVCQ